MKKQKEYINDELLAIWKRNHLDVETRKALMKARLLLGVDKAIIDKFNQVHKDRPEVFRLFAEKAYYMRTLREHYSSKSIMFAIRWDLDVKHLEDTFKINDAYIALYTRKLILKDPDTFLTFFKLRELRFMKLNSTAEKGEKFLKARNA